jgi:tetratricopeptide (TPR) repeat protein
MTYVNDRDQTHLCGPISIEDLQTDSLKVWYDKNYDALSLSKKPNKWKKNLKKTTVDIYLGTWCGDSKKYVPQFIKLWEELGLNTDQLNFIALYGGSEKTKQGPNGEEKGKKIHRVPTFIFNQDGKEYARIVERPGTDLEIDIAQIALGYASTPKYGAANYMLDMFANHSLQDIEKDYRKHVNTAYRLAGRSSSELNTLGYVLLRAGKIDEALITFMYNARFHKYDPNVYDSYGEALALKGDIDQAIINYEKVLEIDPENENAKEQLEKLKTE